MLSFFSEIEETKEQVTSLEKEIQKLSKDRSLSESRLEKAFKKHDKAQQSIEVKETQFKEEKNSLKDKMDVNRKDFSSVQQQLLILDQQKDEILARLENVEKDLNTSNNLVRDLKKKILV